MWISRRLGYSDSYPFTRDDNSRNIHDKMVNKLFVASTTKNKMPPEKSLGVGWDSLKFSFHSLLLLILLSHQAFILVWSRIIHIFDRVLVISDKVWRTTTLFASPFWCLRNIQHYSLLPEPVTERGGYQRPLSMVINTTTTLDSFRLLDPPF